MSIERSRNIQLPGPSAPVVPLLRPARTYEAARPHLAGVHSPDGREARAAHIRTVARAAGSDHRTWRNGPSRRLAAIQAVERCDLKAQLQPVRLRGGGTGSARFQVG